MRRLLALLLASGWVFSGAPHAADARPAASDPAIEAKTMALAEQLRCLVCQNQTIADSHAGLAVDLKNQIREKLAAGSSEAEILEYMVARYGDFVLYRPPLKLTTMLLWAGPFILLLLGCGVLVVYVRRRRTVAGTAEQADDVQALARVQALLNAKEKDR